MSSQKLFSNSSKELFSEKFYEAVNNDSSDLSKYDLECNEIIVHDPRGEMIKICKKYLRYLEYCKLFYDDNSLYKVSVLFNYWLYCVLTHIYGFNSIEQIITGFSALQLKWTNFDYRRISESYYLKSRNLDDDCDHYKKIEEKKSLYEHFDEQCLLDNYICAYFYDKFMPYKPDSVLSQLPCHEQIAREQVDAKAAERPDAMQHTLGSEQDAAVGPLGPGAPGFGCGSETEVTSGISQLYSPIGSWIRNLGKNSTNSLSDMDGVMEGFLGDTQESGGILLGETSNYISYQSM
ncbi:Plasmodium vivax Vir protein, putative [Plasmodium ovale]|uniref:Plasmodium vivax Vir protein, putative n=1 Tax=Plasmodium ovale TaxID=36330 RepID=A0A1C3KER2_PLAOA|nr:Plasmodium vivax Vir protein, putative [Plasmodium ovale]